MFLSFGPRRQHPWAFRVLNGDDDHCNFDFLTNHVSPMVNYYPPRARWSGNKKQKLPLKKRTTPEEVESTTIPVKKSRFELEIDTEGFNPSELNVKLVDNCLTIQGNHESTDDQGGVFSRQFMRKCTIPDDVNLDEMTCNLDSLKGHMVISAPKKIAQPQIQEKVIPIIIQKQADTTESPDENNSSKPDKENEKTPNSDENMNSEISEPQPT